MLDDAGLRAGVASGGGITIRAATAADEPAIGAYLGNAYHPWGRFKYPERWCWQFVANPFGTSARLPVWLALWGNEIIGQVTSTPVQIWTPSGVVAGVSQGDLMVAPEFRKMGIAGALLRASRDGCEVALNIWAAPISLRILRRLGFVELPALDGLRLVPGAAGSLTPVVSPVQVRQVTSFGDDADGLWREIEPEFRLAVVRGSRYLNWKFVAQPHVHYSLYEARKGDRLRGVVTVRETVPPEPPMAIVSELVAGRHDSETLDAICRFVARRHGHSKDVTASTSVKEYRDAFGRCGFAPDPRRRPVAPWVWSRDGLTELAAVGHEALIGRADSDWDQYPYAGMA